MEIDKRVVYHYFDSIKDNLPSNSKVDSYSPHYANWNYVQIVYSYGFGVFVKYGRLNFDYLEYLRDWKISQILDRSI